MTKRCPPCGDGSTFSPVRINSRKLVQAENHIPKNILMDCSGNTASVSLAFFSHYLFIFTNSHLFKETYK